MAKPDLMIRAKKPLSVVSVDLHRSVFPAPVF